MAITTLKIGVIRASCVYRVRVWARRGSPVILLSLWRVLPVSPSPVIVLWRVIIVSWLAVTSSPVSIKIVASVIIVRVISFAVVAHIIISIIRSAILYSFLRALMRVVKTSMLFVVYVDLFFRS